MCVLCSQDKQPVCQFVTDRLLHNSRYIHVQSIFDIVIVLNTIVCNFFVLHIRS